MVPAPLYYPDHPELERSYSSYIDKSPPCRGNDGLLKMVGGERHLLIYQLDCDESGENLSYDKRVIYRSVVPVDVPCVHTIMPHEVVFELMPIGVAATSTRAEDGVASIRGQEFTSTEDGQLFIHRLERFPQKLLDMLETQCGVTIQASTVDHILAIVRLDRTATVYINELPHTLVVRASRPFKRGEAVFKNDLIDIERLNLGDINIPADAGVLFLFSAGWRKGLFFDFLPLHPHRPTSRTFDCATVFGQLFTRVFFQERFSILDSEWEILLRAKLFPFVGLANETLDRMLSHLRAGWPLSELSDAIVLEVKARINEYLAIWRDDSNFKAHRQVLDRAAERFLAEDYMSSIGLLLPRIEGILRSHHLTIGRQDKPTQAALTESAVSAKSNSGSSALLPLRFQEYLNQVYFASFDGQTIPGAADIDVSRHSVAHGVVSQASFTPFNTALAFLVLYQLFYCFRTESSGEGFAELQR